MPWRAFGPSFFQQWQWLLLVLLDEPLLGRWLRWVLCIRRCDVGHRGRIVALSPHAYVVANADGSFTMDVRTHWKYAKRLYYAFRPLWWTLHAWDACIANPLVPACNAGFDVLTVRPDPDPESTTVDGVAIRSGVNQPWVTLIKAAGTSSNDVATTCAMTRLAASTTSNQWAEYRRAFFLFNTAAIGASAIISSAVLSFFGSSKSDGLGTSPDTDIYAATPASNTAIAAADFQQVGYTSYTDAPITNTAFVLAAYNTWTLNSVGRGAIAKTGISKFGTRFARVDTLFDTGSPTWVSGASSTQMVFTADETGTASDPKLVVTYSIPIAAAPYEDPCAIVGPRLHLKLNTGTATYRYATHPLRDTTAMGGYKEPRILEVGAIARAASDVASGAWSVQSATVRLADTDRVLRGISHTRQGLRNSDAEVYLTSTTQRQAGLPPRVLFSGKVFNDAADENLALSLELNDLIGVSYTLFAEEKMLPQRVVSVVDFPLAPEASLGLGVPIVAGDLTSAPTSAATSTPGVLDCIYVGQVRIGGAAGSAGPATLAAVVAALQASHTAGDLVADFGSRIGYADAATLQAMGSVPTTYSALAAVIGGGDLDALLATGGVAGGTLYEAVVVAGHAVKEIKNIWVDDVEVNYGAQLGVSVWAPQIAGDATWAAAFGANLFTDIVGTDGATRRYTMILFSTGGAYGIAVATGAQVHVNVIGFETVGDGTGTAITDYFQQYKHVLVNFALQDYQSGAWLAVPQFLFSDGVTLIDRVNTQSFDTASVTAAVRLPGGFIGGFAIGSGGERSAIRDVIGTFNFSAGCFLAQDDYGRLFAYAFDRRRTQFYRHPITSVTHRTLRDKVDILPGFKLVPRPDWQVNQIAFQYAEHYHNGTWDRNYGGGGTTTSPLDDLDSQALNGVIKKEMQFRYVRHDATALAVATLYLERLANLPYLATYSRRGLCGLEDDLLYGLPITHFNGYGSGGWVNHGVLTLAQVFNPREQRCDFVALDVENQLTDEGEVLLNGSGGTETLDGPDKIHTFTSSGSFAVTGEGIVQYLLVGGGGGGGSDGGGGGGAGKMRIGSQLVSTGSYAITVGAGGAGGGSGNGTTGVTSSFASFASAVGGGGGGSNNNVGTAGGNAGGGGGGGNPAGGSGTEGAGGTGTFAGGSGLRLTGSAANGGGGGGATAVGANASTSAGGAGGAGGSSSITGSAVTYGGGGGGAAQSGDTVGAGGSGGGGAGSNSGNGTAGTANRGGGGGGGHDFTGSAHVGGAGGAGVVIIRYTPLYA